jgi:hypothetical protein
MDPFKMRSLHSVNHISIMGTLVNPQRMPLVSNNHISVPLQLFSNLHTSKQINPVNLLQKPHSSFRPATYFLHQYPPHRTLEHLPHDDFRLVCANTLLS